jgi:hypothetical protein
MEQIKTENPDHSKKVKFNYIKSNFFRVIHADGAWGGLSANGQIHMTLYNERLPIPQQITHLVSSEGKLGEELKEARISKEGFIREIEVDVVMDLDVAKAIAKWLESKINFVENLKNKSQKKDKNA